MTKQKNAVAAILATTAIMAGQPAFAGLSVLTGIDYSSGENTTLFTYDVLTQGPVLGFAFRF